MGCRSEVSNLRWETNPSNARQTHFLMEHDGFSADIPRFSKREVGRVTNSLPDINETRAALRILLLAQVESVKSSFRPKTVFRIHTRTCARFRRFVPSVALYFARRCVRSHGHVYYRSSTGGFTISHKTISCASCVRMFSIAVVMNLNLVDSVSLSMTRSSRVTGR